MLRKLPSTVPVDPLVSLRLACFAGAPQAHGLTREVTQVGEKSGCGSPAHARDAGVGWPGVPTPGGYEGRWQWNFR